MAIELTPDNWQSVVIDGSRTTPVLVDFWAPWCGPCRQLAPILESLEAGAAGRWILGKANIEAHPELGERHGVSGIPAMKLFVDGAAIGETVGLQLELQLRGWLDTLLPGEERAHLATGQAAEAAGDLAAARAAYESALAVKALMPEATIGLARVLAAAGEGDEALERLDGQLGPEAARARLAALACGGPTLEAARTAAAAAPRDAAAAAQLALGLAAAAADQYDEALAALLEVVRLDRALGDDAGRRAMLDVFEVLGAGSSLVDDYRRKLAMVLY